MKQGFGENDKEKCWVDMTYGSIFFGYIGILLSLSLSIANIYQAPLSLRADFSWSIDLGCLCLLSGTFILGENRNPNQNFLAYVWTPWD
jgi:hypothetical protein